MEEKLGFEQSDANQSNLFIFAKELGFGRASLSKLVKKNGKANQERITFINIICSHNPKPDFSKVMHTNIRLLQVFLKNPFAVMGEKPI